MRAARLGRALKVGGSKFCVDEATEVLLNRFIVREAATNWEARHSALGPRGQVEALAKAR